ncbi:hypothetical protein [Nocardia amamiensis]|uniref:hypothetical protein n=1 Tax=Nocardia amamiensis TaxID=404578 RepID=UPI0008321382|nr:hypothetical protein [Nocardia amamiensis]
MRSLESRIGDTIDDLKRLGHAPDTARIGEIQEHLAELVTEVRRTINEVDDTRRYNLIQLSRQAHSLFVDARARAERAVNIADAARQREMHALAHPTVLDPDPLRDHTFPRSALADVFEREHQWDGFDR